MNHRLIIRKRAETHIEDAYDWYEQRKKDLGSDFLQAIEEALKIIEINPLAFQFKYKTIRAIYTKRFPYGIFYTMDKETIIVLAVFHLSQDPKLWKQLTK
jgi:toxin ParE1/3/4